MNTGGNIPVRRITQITFSAARQIGKLVLGRTITSGLTLHCLSKFTTLIKQLYY
jgi:hypothetical protein